VIIKPSINWAISKGDGFLEINHDSQGSGEQGSVGIIDPDLWYIYLQNWANPIGE